ncbi:MAG: hypothetical protein J7455_12265 [Roseiflexus sp.]|jgi:4-amino-4-deoxy-L-arabinose transferase-like glycosyltransferase|nr:hypothetical protein [Roseiflexus sp.]MBO9383158.1 hypothetical protein [Roseiflexus sp.]
MSASCEPHDLNQPNQSRGAHALRRSCGVADRCRNITQLIGLWNLEGPEFWWDEGWTLSVASNVVERGHYGRLLDGQPAPGGLEASPVVTLPVALSFQILGVGLWQGRLVSLMCAAAALALMFVLAARLYDQRVAWGTSGALLLLLTAHLQLNALLTG